MIKNYISIILTLTLLSLITGACNSQSDDESEDAGFYTKGVRFSAKEYMTLTPSSELGPQGASCYGDYFVQAYSNNKYLTVYNLKTKTKIGDIIVSAPAASSKIHCNTINFGSQRFAADDEFPVLYVNSGYTYNGSQKLFVYRITANDGSSEYAYTARLIQTISLVGFGSWTEGIIDNENNYLWVKYENGGANGLYGYAKFELPDIHTGDISIHYSEQLDDFKLAFVPTNSSNQCHLFYHDRIILVSGGRDNTQPVAFIAVNTLSQEEELILNLKKAGLKGEPEGLIRYGNQFMISYSNKLYTFETEYF